MRPIDEILSRIEEVEPGDFFGAQLDGLIQALPFEHAKRWLLDDEASEAIWEEDRSKDPKADAVKYLEFAVGKALDHRGLSAGRDIDHYRGWLWLLCTDEEFAEFEETDYEPYGVPQLKVAARLLGVEEWFTTRCETDGRLMRMADGDSCSRDCQEGCGF